jgi:hypothetical protein
MKKKLFILLLLMAVLLGACSPNHGVVSASDVSALSINHLDFVQPVSDQFKFIVYGHSYGTALDADEYPSITLRSNLDNLLAMKPNFIFSLGDMVEQANSQQFSDLQSMLLSKYDMPVFNVVGNHDVKNRELYNELFGPQTYYSFVYANAMFVVLDTEIDDCYIKGDQLEMLQSAINEALQDENIDTIFIMMHKVLYMDSYLMTVNESAMVRTNDLKIFAGSNFTEINDSILIPAAKKKPIHIFAGDVGAFNGNLSPYYQKDKRADLYMYASGLGDSENDVVLIVTNHGDKVTVEPYLLATGEKLNIEEYDESYWRYYGVDRWEKYRPVIEFGKQCALDVCKVGKNTFHIQCRYFILLLGGLFFTGMLVIFVRIRKKSKWVNR